MITTIREAIEKNTWIERVFFENENTAVVYGKEVYSLFFRLPEKCRQVVMKNIDLLPRALEIAQDEGCSENDIELIKCRCLRR